MASYYVSNAGSDAAAGTSSGASWQTLAKVQAAALAAGDVVYLNKGDTWREMLTLAPSGTAGNPITFDAYGSGANPVVKGSDVVSTSGWTLTSGQSSTYQKTFSFYTNATAPADRTTAGNVLVEDGTLMTRKASVAAVEATACSYYYSGGVLYVHATGNGSPGTNGKAYEAPARSYCIRTTGGGTANNYLTFQNITVEHAQTAGFYLGINTGNTCHDLRVLNCTARRNGQVGIWMTGYTNYVGYNDISENRMYGGAYVHGMAGGTTTVTYNDAHDNGTDPALDANGRYRDHGIYVYVNGGTTDTRLNVSRNNTGHGFKVAADSVGGDFVSNIALGNGYCGFFVDSRSTGSTFDYNTAVGNSIGFGVQDATPTITRVVRNTFAMNTDDRIDYGAARGRGANNNSCTITTWDYNVIWGAANMNYSGQVAGAHDYALTTRLRFQAPSAGKANAGVWFGVTS